MKLLTRCLIFTLAFTMPLSAHASALRVTCEGANIGAEVSINGKFKGECPIDIEVPAGTIKLRVVKKIDKEYERVFEQELRMGEGVAKKIDAVLARGLTAAGEKRLKTPLAQLIAEANKGDAFAQWVLGTKYYSGNGVMKDNVEAVKWMLKAAEQGYDQAQYKLGLDYYMKGLEAKKDDLSPDSNFKAAMNWFHKAADQGYIAAQLKLGEMYQVGKGAPVNCEEAARWFRKAAELGDTNAPGFLAILYLGSCDKNFFNREEAEKWKLKFEQN